jgi:hypothetical protein
MYKKFSFYNIRHIIYCKTGIQGKNTKVSHSFRGTCFRCIRLFFSENPRVTSWMDNTQQVEFASLHKAFIEGKGDIRTLCREFANIFKRGYFFDPLDLETFAIRMLSDRKSFFKG